MIPVKDGAYWLEKTLGGIAAQSLASQTEVIILDSGSTDSSLEIAGRFGARVEHIAPADFNHGETRNVGARLSRGKYVVMTVQDAWTEDSYWLQKLLDGFVDGEVAGVCGSQMVPIAADINPVAWSRPISEPRIRKVKLDDPATFEKLSPRQKKELCGWDDVNAMYHRETLLQYPFRKMMFGEDIQWAQDTLLRGGAIVYNHAARVFHYHQHEPDYSFKRIYTECYFKYKLFGLRPETADGLMDYLRDLKILMTISDLTIRQRLGWIPYNLRLRAAENRTVRRFNQDLDKGEDYLDRYYLSQFKTSPMAPKPKA